ncbi:MAG: hypothetical protein HWQ43_00800 [Nostoc sp. JL31]|uniref:hypothetical protein n=1 Tax=Nostoc sp. JL31 TaxID=2815395 RepID=UPI0025F85894|nr:hypothetical protein [Nostoc sp. JL31]MBN3887761.1 hypothetical protein [Nostoc sp. JL31]
MSTTGYAYALQKISTTKPRPVTACCLLEIACCGRVNAIAMVILINKQISGKSQT